MKKFGQYVAVYLLTVPILALGLWIFFLGRETIGGLLSIYFAGDSIQRSYQAGFFDRMLTLFLGLGWLVLFVVSEELLRRQVDRPRRMLNLYARFLAVLLLTIFTLDLIMLLFVNGIGAASSLRWLILAGELALGLAFVYLGWSPRTPWREQSPPGVLDGGPGAGRPMKPKRP